MFGKKSGFTLAEVLITLTIIGIIAALTIPNLMQSYRKHERITQIKEAYSIISNAIKMAVAENGDSYTWNNENYTYLIPYLKIQHTCGFIDTKGSNKCFDSAGGGNGNWRNPNGELAPYEGGYSHEWFYNIKLQNGMSLGIKSSDTDIIMAVEVNPNGKHIAGKDVFFFVYDKTSGTLGGGKSTKYYEQDNINNIMNNCNITNTSAQAGWACSRLILRNNWEFPDNYPLKL